MGFVTWRGYGWVVLASFAASFALALMQAGAVGHINEVTAAIILFTGLVVFFIGRQLNGRIAATDDDDVIEYQEPLFPGVPHTFQGFPVQYWSILYFVIGGLMLLAAFKPPPN